MTLLCEMLWELSTYAVSWFIRVVQQVDIVSHNKQPSVTMTTTVTIYNPLGRGIQTGFLWECGSAPWWIQNGYHTGLNITWWNITCLLKELIQECYNMEQTMNSWKTHKLCFSSYIGFKHTICSFLLPHNLIFTVLQSRTKQYLSSQKCTTLYFEIMCFLQMCSYHPIWTYHQTSNIRCTLVGNKIVDHSDVVGASPVGAAPTTSSLMT